MYDVNKMQNSILKITWFHTPVSHFSQNIHNTMGDISQQKLAMKDSFCSNKEVFCPFLVLNTDQAQYQGNFQRRQHLGSILYTQMWGFGWCLNNKKILCHEKVSIYTLTQYFYSGMYTSGDANLLQYIFEWEPTETIKNLTQL